MTWSVHMDGPWSPEAARRFREQGYDGLTLMPGRDWVPADLDFLHELEGLRQFSFVGRVKNDRAAFDVDTLENLTLITGSKRPIPEVVRPRLTRLVIMDRPGLDVAARWPHLSHLRVGRWNGLDLRLIDGAAELTSFSLEARRQQGTLEGIQTCTSLRSLTIVNYSVQSTLPLRGLDSLSEVRLHAARPTPPHAPLDMAALTSSRLLVLWISHAGRLVNLDSLAKRRFLSGLRLIDCPLSDADMRSLDALPERVSVEIVTR